MPSHGMDGSTMAERPTCGYCVTSSSRVFLTICQFSFKIQSVHWTTGGEGRTPRRHNLHCNTTSLRWDEIPLLISGMSVYTCKLLVGMSGERMVTICHLSNIKFAFSLCDIMFGEFEREWRMYHFLSSVHCRLNVCWILWIQFLQHNSIHMSKSINRLLFNVNDVMMTMWIDVFSVVFIYSSCAGRNEERWCGLQ